MRRFRLHPFGVMLFLYVVLVCLIAHWMIFLRLGYDPWDGLDRLDKGIAFDVAVSSAVSLLGLAQFKWLRFKAQWVRLLVLSEVLGLNLFLFVDYTYFTQYRTHIPFSTLEYFGVTGRFAITLLTSVGSMGFLWIVFLPSLMLISVWFILVRLSPGWFNEPVFFRDLLLWASLAVCLGSLPFIGVAPNLNPPLSSNGVVYFFWSYDFETNYSQPEIDRDISFLKNKIVGQSNELSETYPLVRQIKPRGCRRRTAIRYELCRKKRPNIIFVMLDSIRTAEMGAYGSELNLTPGFDRIRRKGILFSNFFANGVQLRHAEVASFCSMLPNYGAPALKSYLHNRLHCLPEILKQAGYFTSAVIGSLTDYKTKSRRLKKIGFGRVIDASQFGANASRLGWGFSDKVVYSKFLDHLSTLPRPFFSTLFSLNTQYPFEVPKEFQIFNSKDDSHRYFEALSYADQQLYRFVQIAKSQSWWDNTLIFIVGATGNNLAPLHVPKDLLGWVKLYTQVPLLVIGGPIHRSIEVRAIHDQLDLAPTVLDILGVPYQASFIGHSLLSRSNKIAISVRPGNYWAAWGKQGAIVVEAGGVYHHKKDMSRDQVEGLTKVAGAWVRLQSWLLQQDLIWPKETL